MTATILAQSEGQGHRPQRDAPALPFFVYGTLLPGQPNYQLWGEAIRSAVPAMLRGGRLYDLGYYPMLVEGGGATVEGLVVDVDPAHYAAVVALLDYLEGYDGEQPETSDYRRVRRVVTLAGGRQAVAWVYAGRPEFVAGLDPIEGNWPRYARARRDTIADWWRGLGSILERPAGG